MNEDGGRGMYYKSLTIDGKGPYYDAQWSLPEDGKPGEWMPRIETVAMCESGYHICKPEHLVQWIDSTIYEVETRGQVYNYDNKSACHEARLPRKLDQWTPEVQQLFAADCAERVLENFERVYPADMRPREAILAKRKFALGLIALASYVAAYSTGYDAARTAAWVNTAYSAAISAATTSGAHAAANYAASSDSKERAWQTTRLWEYLNRPAEESLELARAKWGAG